MPKRESSNSDVRLMELAARNSSLGGRELLQEIIERGPLPEETERPQARNLRAALAAHEPEHPDYRSPVEQATWLSQQSRALRDMYEHGAEIKGDVLVIPAEEHELSEERETPFITTLPYALNRIGDIERAREFHTLALAISGETADARTQIAVFKTYYDRITGVGRGRFARTNRTEFAETLTRTLEEMRVVAAEMARLETRESIDAEQTAEDREVKVPGARLNTAARRINLREELLRLPAGLSYEQKERLISKTIPELDRRLERGVIRDALYKAIDRAMLRPDPAEYARKLAEFAGTPKDEDPERPVSKEEYLESQRTLLRLCEREHRRLTKLNATLDGNVLEPHEDGRLTQVGSLAQRLRQGLGRNVVDHESERAPHSRLFVSLSEKGARENIFRLPVSSVKAFDTMAKIASAEKLSLRTWAGQNGPEITSGLTGYEADERNRIGTFLKNYVDERLRDPETRALNTSAVFRDARAAIVSATTPETLGRAAADLMRLNERRSDELRRHHAAQQKYTPPSTMPLNTWERNLLFNGRAPDHHTTEMRDLRLHYGLSRSQRMARVAGLREGTTQPSQALKSLLQELETRKTYKAIAHFQASLLNEKMDVEGRAPLHLLSERIPPHERTFLYKLCEERKRDIARPQSVVRTQQTLAENRNAGQPLSRPIGAAPKDNPTFREYMASMGLIERHLLNEELVIRGIGVEGGDSQHKDGRLTITEARTLLPEPLQKEIRLRARNLAWQTLAPEETFAPHPLPEAVRISETIAYIQDELQERASIAQFARTTFLDERVRLKEGTDQARNTNGHLSNAGQEGRKRLVEASVASLDPNDVRKLAELDRYATQTREDVYRAFELLDAQRSALQQARLSSHPRGQGIAHSSKLPQREPTEVVARESLQPETPSHHWPPTPPSFQFQQKTEGFSERAISTMPQLRLLSDREWHFDNLHSILQTEVGKQTSNDKEREAWQHHDEHQNPTWER